MAPSGSCRLIAPEKVAGSGVERDHLAARRGDEHHAVGYHGRGLMTAGHAGGEHPGGLQALHVLRRDLGERAVAPAVIGAADHGPVAVLRLGQAIRRDRLVILQNLRHRRRRRRCGLGRRLRRGDQPEYCGKKPKTKNTRHCHSRLLVQKRACGEQSSDCSIPVYEIYSMRGSARRAEASGDQPRVSAPIFTPMPSTSMLACSYESSTASSHSAGLDTQIDKAAQRSRVSKGESPRLKEFARGT